MDFIEFLEKIKFTSPAWVIMLPIIMAGADIATGWIQATVNNTWDSTKMRRGILRKVGEFLLIVLVYVVQLAIELPFDLSIYVSIYIVIMEAVSILENLNQAGVPIPAWAARILKKAAEKMDEEPKEGEKDDR